MTAGRKINTNSQDWCTPPKYIKVIKEFFGGVIHLDPCSNERSIVEAENEYMLPEKDGLAASWDFPTIYVNPPYGIDKIRNTTIKDWLRRCAESYLECGSEVLALIPVATNTKHWKRYIFGIANSICFLADTRLRFINGKNDKGAPMACAMVYWGKDHQKFYDIFSQYGAVVNIMELNRKKWVSPDLNNSQQILFGRN